MIIATLCRHSPVWPNSIIIRAIKNSTDRQMVEMKVETSYHVHCIIQQSAWSITGGCGTTTKLIIMINRTMSAANSHRKHEWPDSQHKQLHLHVGDREEVLSVNALLLICFTCSYVCISLTTWIYKHMYLFLFTFTLTQLYIIFPHTEKSSKVMM